MFITSDTNIWIDFYEIGRVKHPFLLGYKYYMCRASFEDELIKSKELREELLQNGLFLADITEEEFNLAQDYNREFRKLSVYDSIALALAKKRSLTLLTGDKPLRTAAERVGVECHGILWIYDQLFQFEKISRSDYHEAMTALISAVEDGRCRLPLTDLLARMEI